MMPQAAQEIRRCGIAPPATMTVAFNGEVTWICMGALCRNIMLDIQSA